MKLNKIYNIVVNDIIVYTCTSMRAITEAFSEIRKTEPTAWIQTCYN